MAYRDTFADRLPERSTARLSWDMKDEAGAAILEANLTTLTLTLYNASDLAIINSVNAVNIKNAGRGAIDGTGKLTLTLEPLDNQIVSTPVPLEETHILLIQGTYGTAGLKVLRHEVEIIVRNLDKVP